MHVKTVHWAVSVPNKDELRVRKYMTSEIFPIELEGLPEPTLWRLEAQFGECKELKENKTNTIEKKVSTLGLAIFLRSKSTHNIHLRTDHVRFHLVDASRTRFIRKSARWNDKWSEIKWTDNEIYGKLPLLALAELYADPVRYFPDGSLHFIVEIFYSAKDKQLKVDVDEPEMKKTRIIENLFEYIVNGKTVTLKMADGSKVQANVNKLCESSEAFKQLLTGDQKIEDILIIDFSCQVVTEFLRFIYYGEVHNLDQHAIELFKLSKAYMVDGLAELTMASIMGTITVETVVSVAALAEENRMMELFDECCRVIQASFLYVKSLESWANASAILKGQILSRMVEMTWLQTVSSVAKSE